MAWITSTYVDNLIGATQRAAIDGGSSTVFDQFEAGARTTVISALQACGYVSPDGSASLDASSISTPYLQKLVAGVWVRDAYANRKGITLPLVAQDAAAQLGAMFADARNGTALAPPIPGLLRSSSYGLGGARFAPTSGYGENAKPQIFSRSKLGTF